MSASDFLETKIGEIRKRLEELAPAYNEYVALQGAIEAIAEHLPTGPASATHAAAKAEGRARAPKAAKPHKGRKRRRPGTLKTAMLELIARKPGLTGPQLADELGSARPTLVTLARRLEQDKLIERRRMQTDAGARIGFFPL